ncbi:hypothetical protein HanRHA438_Chr17g0829801 [Helianthus annuus]|nr:hypothetical protein HanRHA438_Chr17g0829801 [Helianthus annuus]
MVSRDVCFIVYRLKRFVAEEVAVKCEDESLIGCMLRGSLLLTEAIEAEAIQRPKTVRDYIKIARRPKTKF